MDLSSLRQLHLPPLKPRETPSRQVGLSLRHLRSATQLWRSLEPGDAERVVEHGSDCMAKRGAALCTAQGREAGGERLHVPLGLKVYTI